MKIPSFMSIYRQLIAASSISSTDPKWDEGNKKIIDLLASWLTTLQFSIDITQVAPNKFNLFATKGQGSGGLLLSGHTDTVPFDQGRWTYNPHQLTEANNCLYGLGTADMKGFFAFILQAVTQIDWNKQSKPLYILATCDEETNMDGARHFTKNTSLAPDLCIIGEPTELVPVKAHKGHISNAIRITGKSGHSSDPKLGVNAIDIMSEVLKTLIQLRNKLTSNYQHLAFEIPNPTLNLGYIQGGDSPNRICGHCELHYDLRPLPNMDLDHLENLLQESLKTLKDKWPNRISIEALHPPIPGYECHLEQPLIKKLENICSTPAKTVNYCTEAPFLQQLCPTIVLGPGSINQAHQPNEFLSLDFINPTIDVLSKTIHNYCF